MNIEVPEKLLPLYTTDKRFIVIGGGRGGAKSHGVGTFLLSQSHTGKNRILCCREVQNSIKDSVWQLLVEKIHQYGWERLFDITDKSIVHKLTGSDFIFKGMYGNAQDIKSTEGIQFAWVEEAQSVSRKSLEVLVPTVRNPKSKIIFTYNPMLEDDPVHVDYMLAEREDTLKVVINHRDNPWFPEVLKSDMEYDRATNMSKYLHVWEGHCEIFSNEMVGAFETVDVWDCQYCIAFIDPSFSDKDGTDRTAVSVVGVSKKGLILFTGISLPKSISDLETRQQILDFLSQFTPIESVIESQLADSSIFFIDAFKSMESAYAVKNLWSYKGQFKNKHERIAATVYANKPTMRILNGTQQAFSLGVSRYYKGKKHEDEIDSLAGAIEHLATSPIVSEYAAAAEVLCRLS
jgi:PBSX family phage terminase large subunit